MTNKLLGIIAINLTIITGLMILQSIPTATAQSGIQKIAICDPDNGACAEIVRTEKKSSFGYTRTLALFNYD